MNSRTKNRVKLVFIATLFALPVMSAWLVFNNPQWLEGGETKNKGELIVPAIPSNIDDYVGSSVAIDLADLKGRWVLAHLDFDGICSLECEKSVHMMQQLHTLFNKDSSRLRRVYFNKSTAVAGDFLSTAPKLKVLPWGDAQISKLTEIVKGLKDGDMLLMDPLGNIMMKYHQDADPYGIQKDLKLLFKTSQIG
ncbi:MAG: hypothetical protein JKX87_05295 [Cycloclasticus sp.]|nr:hypothetical protein [Cycloclasticus sp.]